MSLSILSRRAPRDDGPSVLDDLRELAAAEALMHAAESLGHPERPARAAVATAIDALFETVATWRALDRDELHWDAAWPHLRDEADPWGAALEKAAEEVASAAGDLRSAMSAHCGIKTSTTTEVAAA